MSIVLEPVARCDFPGCRRRATSRPDDPASTATALRWRLHKNGWRTFNRPGWVRQDYCPDHAEEENLP